MTEGTILRRSKTCRFCGSGPILKAKTYCSNACYRDAEHAKGPARFWAKVDKGPHPKGCWLYTGFTKWDGYGWLHRKVNGKNRYLTAHRYAWILSHGVPTNGEHILHNCDVAACCNPDHLRLGTHAENMHDMTLRGRRKMKLTPDAVREIRATFAGIPKGGGWGLNVELAAKYGVTDKTISVIRNGHKRRNVI